MRHRDGGYRWIYTKGELRRDADGRPLRMIGCNLDITERKLREEAHSASEARLRAVIDNSPDVAVQWYDSQGRIILWNAASEKIFGYSASEAVGKTLDQLIHSPEEYQSFLDLLAEIRRSGRSAPPTEFGFRRRNGEAGVCISTLFSIPGPSENDWFVCMDVDITERRRLEEQLRQSQKMEAIGQLAGGIAHDFNNILTAIIGYSDLLLPRLEGADPFLIEAVTAIRHAGERAAGLTRQLLALGRKQMLEPRLIELNEVVANLARLLRPLIAEDIQLTTVLDPDLQVVWVDLAQIEQVIRNLAVNSRDAMPAGGRLSIATSNVHLGEDDCRSRPESKPGDYVQLTVTDTGCGMTHDVMSHIYEPFFTTKEPGKGTGLGLATVYGIVKQSGGFINVDSEVGAGTTFRVLLPTWTGDDPAVAPENSHVAPSGHETILLVEDEAIVREVPRNVLARAGYNVLEARDGKEAMASWERHAGPIHLVLTDVVMPEMSGRELAQRLRERQPNIKILYMSGYTEDTIVRHGVTERSDPFLSKPFTREGLAKKVRQVLNDESESVQ